ncbi:hypothetical protein [Caballeronia ptereochthonis]|uniref:hypothetical protein n=1 Tax=Caballeronia ptereochthonis TaxID=1777144 RepID=UPI00135AB967|nr:hypothetical protein [Caballeronia ptereochthonis]
MSAKINRRRKRDVQAEIKPEDRMHHSRARIAINRVIGSSAKAYSPSRFFSLDAPELFLRK